MRFFYNLPRFSEYLDFNTSGLNFAEFKEVLEAVEEGLRKEGFNFSATSEKRNRLFVAELNFEGLMKFYEITDKRGLDLMIKIEVYRPKWRLGFEAGVLSLYGYNFSSILLGKGNLLSEKLLALFNRKRGRDVYDTLFMLKKQFPFDADVLKANKVEDAPKELILKFLAQLPQKELIALADQVKPFLFKEDDIELVLKAPLFARKFLEDYK